MFLQDLAVWKPKPQQAAPADTLGRVYLEWVLVPVRVFPEGSTGRSQQVGASGGGCWRLSGSFPRASQADYAPSGALGHGHWGERQVPPAMLCPDSWPNDTKFGARSTTQQPWLGWPSPLSSRPLCQEALSGALWSQPPLPHEGGILAASCS